MDTSGLIPPLWRALDGDLRHVDDLEVTRSGAWLGGPLGSLNGAPLRWAHGPRPLGGDPPAWEKTRT